MSLINGFKFVTRDDPDVASALQALDLNTFDGINLGTIGEGAFDLALGLTEPLDPSIGYITAEYKHYKREERKRSLLDTKIDKSDSTPVDLKECVDGVNFLQA